MLVGDTVVTHHSDSKVRLMPRVRPSRGRRGRGLESRHAHEESELLYITSGEAVLDGTTLRPGMLIFVEGGTEYGPILGGPDGLGLLRIEV
jgi:hypothetical protein